MRTAWVSAGRPLSTSPVMTRPLETRVAGPLTRHARYPAGHPSRSHRRAGALELALAGTPRTHLQSRRRAGCPLRSPWRVGRLTLRLAGRSPGLTSTPRPGFRTRAGHPERPIKCVRWNALQKREDVPPKPLPHPSGRSPTTVTLARNQQCTLGHPSRNGPAKGKARRNTPRRDTAPRPSARAGSGDPGSSRYDRAHVAAERR